MGRSESIIQWLVVDDSVEDAEQLDGMLRNGGIAVRPAAADDDTVPRVAFAAGS